MKWRINLCIAFSLLFFWGSVSGQNTLDNLGLSAATPSAIALSTRLLSTSYTGPAFRIRRSSDNELRDVYFDGSGTISLASKVSAAGGGAATATSLTTWIGANSGTVAIWYDQSGNGRDASQATNSKQPRLINAGVVDLKSGRAAVRHLAAGQNYLSVSTAVLASNFWSVNVVESLDGGANQRMLSGLSNWLLGFWNGNERSFYFQGGAGGAFNSGFAASTNNQIYSSIGQGASNALAYQNGTNFSTQGGGVPSSPPTTLLTSSYQTTSEFSNGTIQEITVFSNSISVAERQIIECNQGTYYSISLATPSISLGATAPVSAGTTSVTLPYTLGNGSTYSISWNAAALSAGFTNVTNSPLPASPITVTIPAVGPVAGTLYTGTLTVSNSCSGVSPNYNFNVFITGTNTLDNLSLSAASPSSVAYSLRKLSSAYNGPVLQIRRSSDGELRDVFFDGSGVLSLSSQVSAAGGGDVTATTLGSWIGGNSGTVAIWYDQSGNWRNASQSIVANQPRVINAGVIDSQNGKPAIFLNGTTSYLTETTTSTSNPYSMNAVASRTASNGGYQRLINLSNTSDFYGFLGASVGNYATFAGSGAAWNDVAADVPNTAIGASSAVMSMTVSTGVGGLLPYINGTPENAKNGTAGTSTGLLIGAPIPPGLGLSQLWTGYLQDFEIFPSALSTAARSAMECNQSSYYGVTFTTPTIALGAISPIQAGTPTINLTYGATTGTPTTYSINWGASALAAGFSNVTNAVLPASPITVSIGASAIPGSTYAGVLTVSNACGTSSVNNNFSIPILNSILGLTPSTSASYSLRKLSTTYAGPAIQVRRSSDNATQDIGFTAGGDLDQAALLSFVGANNGFVSIWYDQSGFGRNATQATQAKQPRIVNIGVVDTQNGKPAMVFSGGQTLLSSMTAAQGTNSGTITTSNFVFQTTTANTSIFSNADGGGNRYNLHSPWGDGNSYFDIGNIGAGGRIFGPLVWPSYSIATYRRNGAQGDVWKNGVNSLTSGSFATSVTSVAPMWIGSYDGNQYFITGTLSEMTVFPSALSTADRTTLECSQSSYYSISLAGATGFEVYVQGTVAASACNTANEQVVWKNSDLVNNQATGNNLIKVLSGGWNGGAASWNTVANNGYFQFTASETNTARMAGLSTTNADANYNTIQYAFYLQNTGVLGIYESGTGRGNFGNYSTNDILKIAIEAGVVKYYQNGTLLYISTIAPTLPLLVDVSINSNGGTINNAIVSNYSTGAFAATTVNAGGSPTYQWVLNGSPIVGATSSTYSNTSLSNSDVLSCTVSYAGICGTTVVSSNTITNKSVSAPTSIDFYIQGTADVSACNTADEQVKWKISDLSNVQITGLGNSLSKLQNGGWNGGAASWNTVANNGYLQFTASETNTQRMVGLSTTNVDANYTTIQYAFYLQNTGVLSIFESGAGRGNFGTYATNDILKISVEAGVVKYYQNGTLLYISTIAPTLPLLVDVSIATVGGTVSNAIVSNYSTGTFTATATNAGTPTFQWYVNGTLIGGATSSTYVNTTLANNDVVTCTMQPSLGGCTLVSPYTSNSITNKSVSAPTSIDFYIQGTPALSACNTTDEQVKWKISDLSNVQITGAGNSLNKIQSNGSWNGGAASWNTVANNGYLQFTASETNTYRMIGLSTTNVDANYTTIQYAFYLQNTGTLGIYESGTSRGNFGTYATNDIFKIAVEAGVIKYYQNGTLLYISTIAPTLPLLVDVSIYSSGGTINNVIVSNYSTGTFTATATNAGTPTYQWYVNGSLIGGATSSTYVNTTLANNDVVTCTMQPSLGGCTLVAPYTSNSITNKSVTAPTSIDFYIQGTSAVSACNTADEQVKWKISDLSNVQITGLGNSLSKLQNGGWNGGAASWNMVTNNGYFQFTAIETNTARMAGLSNTNADANYTTIQYAFYLVNTGALVIYESGIFRGNFGTYATNDILKIAVEAGVVKYYQNGTLLYISTIAPTLPLLVDVSIATVGGTVSNAIVSNYSTGTFTATATNAGTPTFQWYVNGTLIGGATSSTYVNTMLANNDVVTCTMQPSLGGCTLVAPYTSNSITNKSVSAPTSIDFYIQGTPALSACNTTDEQVKWKISDLSNVQITGAGNSLNKIQSGGWNGGAASWNTVANNGYLQFTASETNTYRMIGLSTTNVDANYTTIQYAFYLQGTGVLTVYESGTFRGNFGTYATSDILKISVEAGVVKYYQNGTLLYISAIAPTLPLLVDVSINTVGGTINNAIVSNYSTGAFTATATNAGTPTYQWYVNGSLIGGATSSTYVNTTLANNDVVTCTMQPSLGGCTLVAPYTSNSITNKSVSAPTSIDFYIQGIAAVSACNTTDEQVKWKISDLSNVQITGLGNSLNKLQNGGWNGGAASWNTVANNGYMQFTASETNTQRMVGLSTTNADANYTTIQYAFYLQSTGVLGIYESGTGRGNFGTYATNDILKIAVEAGVVKYYQNGTLLYISTIAPTLPLLVDVSINTVGGTVSNAIVSNYSTGTFTATATNAGTPTYQWYVNGSLIGGATSSTYVNTTLANNDVVTCTMQPSLGGCTLVAPYTSNSITNKTVSASTSIDFYVQSTASASACETGSEQVVWQLGSLTNVQATGNNLTKIQSNGSWDGGAASFNTVANNGYMQFTATETNTYRMIGLSTTNVNSNYTTIQYAVYLQNTGIIGIYESGTSRGNFGTYIPGDIFKVAVESGVVKYYKNGTLLYISTIAPTLPLLVDVSIYNTTATLSNVLVSNPVTGTFTATATNAGGSPSYQWKLNGGNVGTNSTTYTNNNLSNGDVVSCVLTPSLGGCSLITYNSNTVTLSNLPAPANIDFYVQATAAVSACQTANEQVVWQIASLTNVQATGNNLTKIQSNGNWDGGAASFNTVSNNGYMQFAATETNTYRAIGLSNTNVNSNYTTIQYAFYLANTATFNIFESGTNRGNFGAYSPGDIFKVTVESNVVKYYKNGTLLYISTIAPTLPLLVDVSMYNSSSTLTNVLVSNPVTGAFTATATNVGASPTYQWKVNGANVGTNSSTYSNTNLSNTDIVSCVLTPNLGGCSLTTYSSNTITMNTLSALVNIDFYVLGTYSSAACQDAIENVVWKISSLSNVQASTNNLTKIQSNGIWDGGAASLNVVNNNGYMKLTATETNTSRMIGLSTSDVNSSYTSIQYAFYLQNTGVLGIFESGASRGNFGTYATNDVLKIAVDNGTVKYYRNNALLFISGVAPTLPLLVDVSINTQGGTLNAVSVTNQTSGVFTATATNAGVSPTYQWVLNGTNVGTNSTTYSNGSLNNNDVLICQLTPNLGNCGVLMYNSNSITMYTPGASTIWTGTTSNSWDVAANWTNGVPDRYTAVTIPSGTPNSATMTTGGNAYDLTINNGASLTMSGSPNFSVYRNWSNAGTFTQATSTVNLVGCSSTNSVSSTATEIFYKLVMNNTGGATVSTSTQQVSNTLSLTNGIITNTSLVQVNNGATVTGGSNSSYVAGKVLKVGNAAFTFPVGKAGFYRPITMSAPGVATDQFTAEYLHAAQAQGSATQAPIDHVSGCEYWTLDRTLGASNVTVTLSWNESACNIGDITLLSDLRVARWNGTQWLNLGNGGTTGTTTNGTIVTSAAVTSFNPIYFTLASVSGLNPLPITLVSFEGTPNNEGVMLSWATASEKNNDFFTLERSSNGVKFDKVADVKGNGTTSKANSYVWQDNPEGTSVYYRLSQTDFDGTATDLKTIFVKLTAHDGDYSIYPNPNNGKFSLSGDLSSIISIDLIGELGNRLQAVPVQREITLINLAQGLYFLQINRLSGPKVIKFIVQ